jgi:hypothetical protein
VSAPLDMSTRNKSVPVPKPLGAAETSSSPLGRNSPSKLYASVATRLVPDPSSHTRRRSPAGFGENPPLSPITTASSSGVRRMKLGNTKLE